MTVQGLGFEEEEGALLRAFGREFFIDNLLVRNQVALFPGSLISDSVSGWI